VNYAQIDEANTDIAERGLMTKSDKGTPVVNPAVTAKASLMSTVLQLNKALGLSASQMGVSGKDQDSRNKADRDARNILEKAALEDDLI
jgi:P27 family predicted phage terminase small subunit